MPALGEAESQEFMDRASRSPGRTVQQRDVEGAFGRRVGRARGKGVEVPVAAGKVVEGKSVGVDAAQEGLDRLDVLAIAVGGSAFAQALGAIPIHEACEHDRELVGARAPAGAGRGGDGPSAQERQTRGSKRQLHGAFNRDGGGVSRGGVGAAAGATCTTATALTEACDDSGFPRASRNGDARCSP